MSIKALSYKVEDMGRYFKSSKKKYIWTFSLDEKQHSLELEFSYLSGKRRLVLDGRVLHESMMLTSSFQYPFTLEGFALNVIQQGDAFELRINNKVFLHELDLNKNREEFVYDDKVNQTQKTDNFYSDAPNFSNQFGNNNFQSNSQKINLNIKFDTPKDNTFSTKPNTKQQIKPIQFGQPGAFEEFEQFGQASNNTSANPFGDSFSVQGFSNNQTNFTQPQQQQKKVDLLDLDEAPPQQPQQQQQTEVVQQQQQQQQQQQPNLFDAFGGQWSNPTSNVQQVQQTQQVNQQQVQQTQQVNQQQQQTNVFDVFGQTQVQQQQVTQQQPITFQQQQPFQQQLVFQQQQQQQPFQQQQQPFQQQQQSFQQTQQPFQQGFAQEFQQQQQPNLNILNLYGPQQQNLGNLAYTAFPQVVQQPIINNQPIQQAQPTPFDLFK